MGGRPVPRRSVAARPRPARLSRRPPEVDRHLVDYLGDEVLSAQAPEARQFLVDTCVLERFNAPVCDAVRGDDASKALLAEIEQANLFLVPLDGRREWFRYHHVFREVLRRELEDARSAENIAGAARAGGRMVRGRRATSRRRSSTCSPRSATPRRPT